MKRKLIIWASYGLIWEVLARVYARPVLLPPLSSVVGVWLDQIANIAVWQHVALSFLRVSGAVMLALVIAMSLAFVAYEKKGISELLQPLISFTARVPNITFILLMLVWFSRTSSVIWIVFLIVFPLLYSGFFDALLGMHPDLIDVLKMYPEKRIVRFRLIYVPTLRHHSWESFKTAFSLGFKVAIMAEILGQVQPGLGYLMHTARTQFDMASLFAYTLWMIAILSAIEWMFNWLNTKTA